MAFFEKEEIPTSAMYTQGGLWDRGDFPDPEPMSQSEWLRDLGVSVPLQDDLNIGGACECW